jgi:hypothetical protein
LIVTSIGASAWFDINHAKLSLPGSNPAAAREHEVVSRSRRKKPPSQAHAQAYRTVAK